MVLLKHLQQPGRSTAGGSWSLLCTSEVFDFDQAHLQRISCSMTRPVDWIVVSALALPHVLYSFVWLNNKAWRRLFQKNSVHFFACIASLLKGEAAPLNHILLLLSTCCTASWHITRHLQP